MNIKQKTEISEKILKTVHDWIKGADQKVSIFLALEGIVLTLLIPNYLKTITVRFQTHTMQFWPGLFIVLAALALATSVFESLHAILPRLSNKIRSHLYFGGIRNMTIDEYKQEMKQMSESSYLNELYEQIHTNSDIAYRKHGRFQRSIIAFIVGMILCMVTYVLLKMYV